MECTSISDVEEELMKRIFLVMAVVLFVLTACASIGRQAVSVEAPAPMQTFGGAPAAAPSVPGMRAPSVSDNAAGGVLDGQKAAEGSATANGQAQERIVIKNADLAIVVKDPQAKMEAIAKMAEDIGGFVVSSQLYQAYTKGGAPAPEASIVIRVPAGKLDDTLTAIKKDAVDVQSETRSGQDVTKEYIDQKSQLRNLEAAEQQLTAIMSEAKKTEDVLNVFNQLTAIRSQIEVVKGQIQYYDEASQLSAISVRIIAEETIKPLEVAGWRPQGEVRDAIQDLIYFFQDFVDFLIWFVLNFLPKLLLIGLVFGLPLWLIVRGIRRWRAKRKAQTPPPPPPAA
jgi:hypothetical protein